MGIIYEEPERRRIALETLQSRLQYEPKILEYGTSGRRGLVTDLTQLEIYINALAELEYLQTLPPGEGGIVPGDNFYYAYDLRPSSTRFVAGDGGRGEIVQALEEAIRTSGMIPVNCGPVPTPALAYYAIGHRKGSMMVTGSHIPFDRNGYKTNTSCGELRKEDEEPINERVRTLRQRYYGQPFAESPFDEKGMLKAGHREMSPPAGEARQAYIRRYVDFFAGEPLRGMRLLVYQHSAVGRDILVEILQALGAEAIPAGRSEVFVPVDTENVDDRQLAVIQALADGLDQPADAVVSTDGDSDRPLVLGIDRRSGRVRFFGGDLLGLLVAEQLGSDGVVVPVNCNDAIDRSRLRDHLEPRTRIGSPYVIAGIRQAVARGKTAVCGWEANGGFLLGSDLRREGRTLQALATRDAVLPILAVLLASAEKGMPLIDLFGTLPRRYGKSALLKKIPRADSRRIVERYAPSAGRTRQEAQEELARFFPASLGFGAVNGLDFTDGMRIFFQGGEVAHVRPSGNADELRIYAYADTQERAEEIARLGIAEPDGILRRLLVAARRP